MTSQPPSGSAIAERMSYQPEPAGLVLAVFFWPAFGPSGLGVSGGYRGFRSSRLRQEPALNLALMGLEIHRRQFSFGRLHAISMRLRLKSASAAALCYRREAAPAPISTSLPKSCISQLMMLAGLRLIDLGMRNSLMKKMLTIASIGLAALLATAMSENAFATTYDFSYDFVDNGQAAPQGDTLPAAIVTGSFTGTGALGDISVDSVLSMSLGGTALTGPFTFSHFVASPYGNAAGTYQPGATVSDAGLNNFLFRNSTTGVYFYVIQPWYNGEQTIATQYSNGAGQYIDYYNGQYVAANFSVTAVPETATWAMMLVGFVGLGLVGYRQTKRKDGAGFSAV